jgi:hypothetical protein
MSVSGIDPCVDGMDVIRVGSMSQARVGVDASSNSIPCQVEEIHDDRTATVRLMPVRVRCQWDGEWDGFEAM